MQHYTIKCGTTTEFYISNISLILYIINTTHLRTFNISIKYQILTINQQYTKNNKVTTYFPAQEKTAASVLLKLFISGNE